MSRLPPGAVLLNDSPDESPTTLPKGALLLGNEVDELPPGATLFEDPMDEEEATGVASTERPGVLGRLGKSFVNTLGDVKGGVETGQKYLNLAAFGPAELAPRQLVAERRGETMLEGSNLGLRQRLSAPEEEVSDISGLVRNFNEVEKSLKRLKDPIFDLPPAEGWIEKATDLAGGLGGLLVRLAIARKITPSSLHGLVRNIMSFEIESLTSGQTPGKGAALGGALEAIGQIPGASLPAKAGKVALESGVFAGLTAAEGGDSKDVILAALLPPSLAGVRKLRSSFKKKLETAESADEVAEVINEAAQAAKDVESGDVKIDDIAGEKAEKKYYEERRRRRLQNKLKGFEAEGSKTEQSGRPSLETLPEEQKAELRRLYDQLTLQEQNTASKVERDIGDEGQTVVGTSEAGLRRAKRDIAEAAGVEEGEAKPEKPLDLKELELQAIQDLAKQREGEKPRGITPQKKALSSKPQLREIDAEDVSVGDRVFTGTDKKRRWTVERIVGEKVQLVDANGSKRLVSFGDSLFKEKEIPSDQESQKRIQGSQSQGEESRGTVQDLEGGKEETEAGGDVQAQAVTELPKGAKLLDAPKTVGIRHGTEVDRAIGIIKEGLRPGSSVSLPGGSDYEGYPVTLEFERTSGNDPYSSPLGPTMHEKAAKVQKAENIKRVFLDTSDFLTKEAAQDAHKQLRTALDEAGLKDTPIEGVKFNEEKETYSYGGKLSFEGLDSYKDYLRKLGDRYQRVSVGKGPSSARDRVVDEFWNELDNAGLKNDTSKEEMIISEMERVGILEVPETKPEPKVFYHGGTLKPGDVVRELTHFGTEKAAKHSAGTKGEVVKVQLDYKNPVQMKDSKRAHITPSRVAEDIERGSPDPRLRYLGKRIKNTQIDEGVLAAEKQLIKELKDLGYDAIEYTNVNEDPGSKSVIVLDPKQVHFLDLPEKAKLLEPSPEEVLGMEKPLSPIQLEAERQANRREAFGQNPPERGQYPGARPGAVNIRIAKDIAERTKQTYRSLRERFSRVAEEASPEVADRAVRVTATRAIAKEERRRFKRDFKTELKKAGLPHDQVSLKKNFSRMMRLGSHFRWEDMMYYALHAKSPAATQRWIARAQQVDHYSPQFAAKLAAKPEMQIGIKLWNDKIAPILNQIRSDFGLPLTPIKPGRFFMNLPKEIPDLRRRMRYLANINKRAFKGSIKPNIKLEEDPDKIMDAILGSHLSMQTVSEFKKSIKKYSTPRDQLTIERYRDEDGNKQERFSKKLPNGRKVTMVPLDLSRNGKNQNIVFVPESVADVWEKPYQDIGTIKGWDKLSGMVTGVAISGSAVPHTRRILSRVASRIGQSGENGWAFLPWVGSRALATKKLISMGGKWGDGLQDILYGIGADRGRGYRVEEFLPKKKVLRKAVGISHDLLFHPDYGVDVRARRAVVDSGLRIQLGNEAVSHLKEGLENGSITRENFGKLVSNLLGAKGRVELGRFVNNSMGWANTQTRSKLLNALSHIFPFIASESGKIPAEIRNLLSLGVSQKAVRAHLKRGQYGRALVSMGGSLASGPLGFFMVLQALNYAINGHYTWDNDEGHIFDLKVGDGTYVTSLDPGIQRPARLLSLPEIADHGLEGLQRIPTEQINEVLTAMAPAIKLMFTGATLASSFLDHLTKDEDLVEALQDTRGRALYLTKGNQLLKTTWASILPTSLARRLVESGEGWILDQDIDRTPGMSALMDVGNLAGFQIKQDPDELKGAGRSGRKSRSRRTVRHGR